jgi:hypothetical protein
MQRAGWYLHPWTGTEHYIEAGSYTSACKRATAIHWQDPPKLSGYECRNCKAYRRKEEANNA